MPIYHYKCKICDGRFAVKENRMNSNTERDCIAVPLCSGLAIRIVAPTSFKLKGKGWYKDGY